MLIDVTKAPLIDSGAPRGSPTGSTAQQQSTPSPVTIALLDQVEIQPLDLIGALQILIAEVRAGLPTTLDGPPTAGAIAPSAAQAPQLLVHLFLQSLPDDAQNFTAWTAAAVQLEAALTAALDKGVAAVTAWRDVPQAVVDGVSDTRAIVLAVLTGTNMNAAGLRPEWLGLAPGLERYWRRRRAARRGLSNPDHEREAGRDIDSDKS